MIKIIKKSETLCLVDVEVRAVLSTPHSGGWGGHDNLGSVRESIDILEGVVRSQIIQIWY